MDESQKLMLINAIETLKRAHPAGLTIRVIRQFDSSIVDSTVVHSK